MLKRTQNRWRMALISAFAIPLSAYAVETANVQVGPIGGSPTVTITDSSANFFLDTGAVTGEFPVRIGTDASDDVLGGVMMTSVTENGRIVSDGEIVYATANTVPNSSTQSVGAGTAGGYSISTRRAGIGPIVRSRRWRRAHEHELWCCLFSL